MRSKRVFGPASDMQGEVDLMRAFALLAWLAVLALVSWRAVGVVVGR